jgi:hypothetical protein
MKLTDPGFKWIPAASHDADSTEFRKRQQARIAAADKARQEASKSTVRQIQRRKS